MTVTAHTAARTWTYDDVAAIGVIHQRLFLDFTSDRYPTIIQNVTRVEVS